MDIQQYCPHKVVTAARAVSRIKNGSRVFIGSGCGEPQHLIHAMIADPKIQDLMLYQMLSFSLGQYLHNPDFLRRFALKLFFVTIPMREAAYQGKIDYIPSYLSEIPEFFKSGQIGIDAALIQVSPPDRFGLVSLGISVDVTREAVRNAKIVIAQVNPFMPRTHGDSYIHVDDIDWLVPHAENILENLTDEVDESIVRRIAYYVSELIDDGSTLQAGYGQIPYALLNHLDHKNDLGVHTHMITDSFIPLFQKGIITNKRKNFMADRAVASFCMGTRATYDFIDNNPRFYFGTADFVNNPRTIGRNDNFISLSSALEVDLTGQVCVDRVGRQFFSGTGDQTNFIRGAALSRGGLSIIALPSTAKDGTSCIVPTLSAGAGLGTLRADVNFVVTEYGIAQLQGKSIYQRVIELTQIAHPHHRAELVAAAKHHHYISSDQLPPPAVDLIFIEDYKSSVRLKNGQTLSVRPLLPSDEIAYRNFFYSLQQETIFFRFFCNINVFSHKMAQDHWGKLDYRKNISLVGLTRKKGNKEIVAIGTYAEMDHDQAEVAFVVREDVQGLGVATHLIRALNAVALQNGFKRFYASVLPDNKTMLHVFTKSYPQARIERKENEITIWMDLDGLAA